MNCYKANAISRNDIRRFIRYLKRQVGLEDVFYFPIVQFLENVLPVLIPDFQLEIVPTEELHLNAFGIIRTSICPFCNGIVA